jgi:hypothetical protein
VKRIKIKIVSGQQPAKILPFYGSGRQAGDKLFGGEEGEDDRRQGHEGSHGRDITPFHARVR